MADLEPLVPSPRASAAAGAAALARPAAREDDGELLPPGVRLRATWAAARGRNALRHRGLAAGVGGAVLVAALAALIVVPREAVRAARSAAPRPGEKVDTAGLALAAAAQRRVVAAADSAVTGQREAAARARAAAQAARARAAALAAAALGGARREAALAEVAELDRLITRAQTSPLPSSYRALAEAPTLRSEPRVRALLDSLDEVEREREAYGTVGGVDPLYVALTNRVTALGRAIEAVADRRRATLQAELADGPPAPAGAAAPVPAGAATPGGDVPAAGAPDAAGGAGAGVRGAAGGGAAGAGGPPQAQDTATAAGAPNPADATGTIPTPGPAAPVAVPALVRLDTTADAARRDSARRALSVLEAQLAAARVRNAAVDTRIAAARARADFVTPPLAMLAAALALAAVSGYAAALLSELRSPRVADVLEAERVTRTRVLAVIRPDAWAVERLRRESDRDLPPLVDIGNAAWRMLYLSLTPTGASVPVVTVTGEEPAVNAAVVANLAALAAEDGRGTLVVDADVGRVGTSRVLGVEGRLGLADALRAGLPLAETVVPIGLGRDARVDVIPAGAHAALPPLSARGGRPVRPVPADPRDTAAAAAASEALRDELARMAADYDFTIVSVAPTERGPEGALRGTLLGPDAIVCAHAGETPLPALAREIARLRARGANVRGLVLWDAPAPELPAPPPRGATPAASRPAVPA